MSKVDETINYDRGWKEAGESLKLGALPEILVSKYLSTSAFDIGAKDCITQFRKTGEADMIKIATILVVIDPDTGHVLAASRRGDNDDWGFMGGKNDGESPLDTVFRETLEESGLVLSEVPDYIGQFKDEEDWTIHVFMMMDRIRARSMCDAFRSGHREVEPGIMVGLVPYSKLVEKTFGEFNKMLLSVILKELI